VNDWRAMLQQMYGNGIFGGNDGAGNAYGGPQTQQAYAMSGLNRMQPQTPINPTATGGGQGWLGSGTAASGGIAAAIEAALAQQRAQQGQQGGTMLTNPYQQPPGQPGSGGRVTLPRNPGGGLLGGYY
jgi:hypothetical protein